MWAVLLATFMSPFLFKYALNKKHEYLESIKKNDDDHSNDDVKSEDVKSDS